MTNVGYFDVLPATTNVAFAGSWSVFPYFKDGIVQKNEDIAVFY